MSKTLRVNVTFNPEVLKRIDEYCSAHNVSRSALISTACLQYVQAMGMLPDVQRQLDEMKDRLNNLSLDQLTIGDYYK